MNDATVIQAALILELQVIGTVYTFPVSTIQYQVYFLYLNIDIITTDAQTICPYNKLRLR